MNIVSQINQSALHISGGCYDEAINCLTHTLKSLRLAMTGDAKLASASQEEESVEEIVLEFLNSSNSTPFVLTHRNQNVRVFQNPLVVRWASFTDIHWEQLSFVALYNLALSHHLKYVDAEEQESIDLEKAASIYEFAHGVLMNQKVKVTPLQVMALMSNLVYIHHNLGNDDKSQKCLEYLLSTWMFVVDAGDVDTLGDSMDGFFDMILPLMSATNSAPAA
jgi:hypothetical protein